MGLEFDELFGDVVINQFINRLNYVTLEIHPVSIA